MSGFTLLELIIVILVLGIFAALGMPALLASLDDAHLDAAATEVATALRFAQLSAAGTGRATRVTVDAAADSLRVEQSAHANLADILDPANTELDAATVESGEALSLAAHPVNRPLAYQVGLSNERFGGVDVVSASFGGNAFVDFSRTGAPSDAGAVVLGLGGRQLTVSIDDLAGRVTVSE